MALPSLGGAGAAPIRATPGIAGAQAGGQKFASVLRGNGAPVQTLASAPQRVSAHHATAAKAIQQVGAPQATPKPVGAAPSTATRPSAVHANAVVDRVAQAQARMENVLRLAQSGRDFSPAELLSLQTQAYQASQELDLAGKVVEKATNGVKQILQTQV